MKHRISHKESIQSPTTAMKLYKCQDEPEPPKIISLLRRIGNCNKYIGNLALKEHNQQNYCFSVQNH